MDQPLKPKQTSREAFSHWMTLTRLRLCCAARSLFHMKKETVEMKLQNDLLEDLNRALNTLRATRTAFSEARDPDLIEALIYEMKTAEAQYQFLLKKAKETGLTLTHSVRP